MLRLDGGEAMSGKDSFIKRESKRLADAMVGKTVRHILVDDSPESIRNFGAPVFGFAMNDGTRIWVLCDPEGNGPGFLSVEENK